MHAHQFIWLTTVGAVLPYLAVAAVGWLGKRRHRLPPSGVK